MSAKTIIQPNQPDFLAFENYRGAVKVTAYGLIGKDILKFKRIIQESGQPNFNKDGCHVHTPAPSEIALSADYQIGECEPTIHTQRNTIFIAETGRFLPVLVGNESLGSLVVQVESVSMREFSAAELGVLPCNKKACVSDVWAWTGTERCNDDVVEREFINECGEKKWEAARNVAWWETGITRCRDFRVENQEQSECGKIRWARTDEFCGALPSVPLTISDDCCNHFTVYLFHPDEPRDPAATVAITDCDTQIVGYAYPNAGLGHTAAIKDCEGIIYGYAANRGNAPPNSQPNALCDDVKEFMVTIPIDEYITTTIPEIIVPIFDDNGTVISHEIVQPAKTIITQGNKTTLTF